MAHIICMTSGLRGLLNASFELVDRLARAGHRVTYACPHDVKDAVEAQGLAYVQLPPVNFDPAPPPANTDGSLGARLDEWRGAAARREAGIEAMNLQPFRDFIQTSAPDLVLIDAELYEHIFALFEMRTPMGLITPFFASWRQTGVPPLVLDVIPGRGWRGSTPGLLLQWWQRRLQRFKEVKMVGLRNAFTERRSVLKALARQVGYPLRHLEEYSSNTLFNDNHLPVLMLTASELDFASTLRADAYYVGPMVARTRVDETVGVEDRARLKVIYEARARGGRLLYCWLTTMQKQDTDFLNRVIEAVSGHPEWTLIVGFSGADTATEASDNVHLFSYVPQIEVLEHADLCITYGGMNTMHECVVQQTPMLVYPRFFDQPGVSARLLYHGLAHRGRVASDSAARIRQRIDAVLTEEGLGQRLRAAAETVARYDAENTAAKVVESLLAR